MRQLPAIKMVVMVAADTRWPDMAAAADKPLPDVAAADARWLAPPVADMDRLAMLVAVVLSDPAVAATTAVVATMAAAARSTTAAPVMATAMVDAPAMAFPLSAP
jgi:hypothetical protein